MRIVCYQTIFMKYHALFVIFEKAEKCEIVIGGVLQMLFNCGAQLLSVSLRIEGWISCSRLI